MVVERSRTQENILVVIPPLDLLDHGQLVGPRHRLSQGILMPMFPSMAGQLDAIAREYNFPSTVGLCLFLRVNENGRAMTPRISDDSWQYLFGHLSAGRSSSDSQQLPIGGCIEFDIDLNKAQWFDSWISRTLPDSDLAVGNSLEAHQTGTTILEKQPVEDQCNVSGSNTLVTNSRPETLHLLPKTLPLVDRSESHAVHVSPKSQDLDLPKSSPSHGSYALLPILQPDIPLAAGNELEHRINSWRASTELYPVPLAEAYQTAMVAHHFRHDYTWSATSERPRTITAESPIVSPLPSSIHIDRWTNGTIPLTPIAIASWGPADDTWHSAVSSVPRLPWPDTGERVIENVMVSRSRAVWGNSFGWHSAMTWNQVYPYAFIETKPAIMVQLPGADGLEHQYPNLVIYPSMDSLNNSKDLNSSPRPVWGSSFGWQRTMTWRNAYPYSAVQSVGPFQLRGAGRSEPKYPNICIYPPVYPYFEIYPACSVEENVPQPVSVILDESDKVLARYPILVIYPAVYPHLDIYPPVIESLKTMGPSQVDGNTISKPKSESAADSVVRKEAIWGNSFGWKTASTWRAVWPTPYAQTSPNVSPTLGQQGDFSSNYPRLAIYPSVYPHLDIYPPPAAAQSTEENEHTVDLILHYPNLLIYPATYPHFDLYPATARAFVALERATNLRRRRIEMWRAKMAAQVGLSELLLNNHVWEVDEPFRLDLADYAWSRTSAGPGTSPLELLDTPSISGSLHIDRRIQGSVIRTPSIATTWGPQDDDWCSKIDMIERLPSPDLGQRALDDVENVEFSYRPWHMIPSVLEQSVFTSGYPQLVIYPPVYPHFELYPATFENEVTETLVYSSLDRHSAHFNIHPAIDSQIEIPSKMVPNVQHESLDVKLVSVYPHFDIYPPVYPFMILYPCVLAEISQPSGPEQSPVFSSVEWKPVSVKLPSQYPVFELYPAGYPWSLQFIYPAVSIDDVDDRSVILKPRYPCIRIDSPVYPFVEPYPGATDFVQVPGTIDEDAYESAKAILASLEFKPIDPGPAIHVYPYLDLNSAEANPVTWQARVEQDAYVGTNLTTPSMRSHIPTGKQRKTHQELYDLAFRSRGKQPARIPKTHLQLHTEVFQDGIVWTPCGFAQELSSFTTKKREDVPMTETRPIRLTKGNPTPRPSHSRSEANGIPSSDRIAFPLVQPPPLPPRSPLRPRIASQPAPPVSETPKPHGLPTSFPIRSRTARLSQAVKAMTGGHRRHVSAAPANPSPEDQGTCRVPNEVLLVDRPTADSCGSQHA